MMSSANISETQQNETKNVINSFFILEIVSE